MSLLLPRKLKNLNVFVEGGSYAGLLETFTPPKLARKMLDYWGAGMQGPVKLDMGQEALEFSAQFGEFNEDIMATYSSLSVSGVAWKLKGSIEDDDDDTRIQGVTMMMYGRSNEIDWGDWKPGEDTALKISGALTYFKYTSNGSDIIEIDMINSIRKIRGVDLLATRRANLGLS